MSEGIYTSHESSGKDTVLVRSCEFYANRYGVILIGDGGVATITDCFFDLMARNGIHVAASRQSLLAIEGCTFSLWDHHQWPQKHLGHFAVRNSHVRDCEFLEGSTAITASDGSAVLVERSTFDGQSRTAIYAGHAGAMTVTESRFVNQREITFSGTSWNAITFSSCTLESVADVAFRFAYVGNLTVNDCDLSGGERGIVWCEDIHNCTEVRTLDMTGNYWGTADPDSVESLIRDNSDSEEACFIIDYEPFESESTPVESKSLSDLKSLFR